MYRSKVLSISDGDMDGVTCQIIIGNVFDKRGITYVTASHNTINDILNKIDFDKYDYVFITDISPKSNNLAYQLNYDKIILIDHHDTCQDLHDSSNDKFIVKDMCSASMLRNFLTNNGANIDYLDTLITLVDDYDMWTEVCPGSKDLARLFYNYKPITFKRRFFSGLKEFSPKDLHIIEKDKLKLKQLTEDLKKDQNYKLLPFINAITLFASSFTNEIAHQKLSEGYNVVFVVNKYYNVSVRSRLDDIHIGKVLKEKGIGGGHKYAAGFPATDFTNTDKLINTVCDSVYENSLSLRKDSIYS
jgi:oligoribonuclease NrnB/cAMP/cGMP phosphodiesterase (DHH superfamily)